MTGSLLGWILFVIFTPLVLYITYIRFRGRNETLSYYLMVALIWMAIAIVFDYFFIVKFFGAQDYYKPDVVIYYLTTFLIPLVIGYRYGRGQK